MAEFITIPIETDPDELSQEALDYLASVIPGFNANAANLETWLVEATARIAAEVRDVASDVPPAIFRYYGATIAGLPPVDAAPASVVSTWTMIDAQGYTIPVGTQVAIAASGDSLIGFETIENVNVPEDETVAVGVVLVAVEPGANGNDLTSAPLLITPLDFVASITLDSTTGGGADAEADDVYLSRLRSELQLLTPRPILPRDFAVLARRIAGVDRALAVDGLIPDVGTGQERAVAVAVIDSAGAPCSAPVKAAVDALLQSLREVNFIVSVIDPDTTSIYVDFTATLDSSSGFDAATVEAAAISAIESYLDPANWGESRFGDTRDWNLIDKVRYLEVASVINDVDGVDYITALTVNAGTIDVTLAGDAPLTAIGTITGAVA